MDARRTIGREALSVSEAAQAAGLGRATLYELFRSGEGPPTFRVGRRRLVRVEALREWLRQRESGQTGTSSSGAVL